MGKKSAIQKSAKGDLIPTPGPLDQQIEGAHIAKARSADREKRKRRSEQTSDEVSALIRSHFFLLGF